MGWNVGSSTKRVAFGLLSLGLVSFVVGSCVLEGSMVGAAVATSAPSASSTTGPVPTSSGNLSADLTELRHLVATDPIGQLGAEVDKLQRDVQETEKELGSKLTPAAADEVSAAIAALFGRYGREYQAIAAQADALHEQFVQALNAGGGSNSAG
jgi:hypothetical protein